MNKFTIDLPMRVFLLVISAVIWAGLWLTGFDKIHWLLYLPAVFFVFAGVVGICPGMAFSRMLFGKKS